MDVSTITALISSVGFPIACCIYLIYSNIKTEEKHAEELEKIRQTVENNTHAMIKLCERIGIDYGKD